MSTRDGFKARKEAFATALTRLADFFVRRGQQDLLARAQDLRDKLAAEQFNLVVLGQFKRGKSTLINALLGADLLPTAVAFPSVVLMDGVRLVDTPGVGSVFAGNTGTTLDYLPEADAAIFLLAADQPISQAELEFLQAVRQHAAKFFFVLNKIDYLSERELKESMEFSARVISESLASQVVIHPLSARSALMARLDDPLLVRLIARIRATERIMGRQTQVIRTRQMRGVLISYHRRWCQPSGESILCVGYGTSYFQQSRLKTSTLQLPTRRSSSPDALYCGAWWRCSHPWYCLPAS
jgi:GTP-binding protein EngB required for normal cell division